MIFTHTSKSLYWFSSCLNFLLLKRIFHYQREFSTLKKNFPLSKGFFHQKNFPLSKRIFHDQRVFSTIEMNFSWSKCIFPLLKNIHFSNAEKNFSNIKLRKYSLTIYYLARFYYFLTLFHIFIQKSGPIKIFQYSNIQKTWNFLIFFDIDIITIYILIEVSKNLCKMQKNNFFFIKINWIMKSVPNFQKVYNNIFNPMALQLLFHWHPPYS